MHERPSQRRNAFHEWLGRPLNLAILLFIAAFFFRLLVLLALHDSPYWGHQLVDAKLYDDWAAALADGRDPHPAPYFYSPVYSWALSGIYRIFGHSLTAARLLQCALGSLLCVFVYLLARRLLSSRAALAAGLFCALFGTLAFYDNLLLKTAPVTFLLFAGVYLLYLEPEKRAFSLGRFFLAGASLGLAAGMRGNALLVGVAVLLFLAVEEMRKRKFVPPALFLLGLAAPILPLTIANYAASGEIVLTTYSGGFNFYEGNSAEATGYHPALASVRQTAAYEQEDVVAAAREAVGREPSPGEVSRYWSARAWRDIREDPGGWCRLLAFKAALFANHAEIPDNYNYGFMSERLAPLGRNPLGYYLLAPFAIAGLGMAIAMGGRWRLLVLVVLVYSGSVILFYVTARYRAPVIPFLAILAALAVRRILKWLASQDYQKAFVACVAVFGLFIAVAKPLVPRELGFGREFYAIGNIELERDRDGSAVENYIRALEYHPSSALIENNLGAAYLRAAGRDEERRASYLDIAALHLRRALERKPDYFEAWKNLGIARAAAGDAEGARDALRMAFRLAPGPSQQERIRLMLNAISR